MVADVDATEKIIEKLGYPLAIVYEKHRKAWHFGNVEVVLDELPFGYYMEIEGRSKIFSPPKGCSASKRLRPNHVAILD